MIYTITLNPALDRTLWADKITKDDSNRILKEERYAGGKGIDVSRVLSTLGVKSTVLGLIGGFTGEELFGRLLGDGIHCDFVRIAGETRTNVIIYDGSDGQYLFSGPGPVIKPEELGRFIHKIDGLSDPEMIIIGGSLPPGVSSRTCRDMIEMAKGKGAVVLLDADGEALKEGIKGRPDFIKPNLHELCRIVDEDLNGIEEIAAAARMVRDRGAGAVLVSMGGDGILFVGEKEVLLAVPPEVKVVNTVGAGDSAVAGFVYALAEGRSFKDAIIYAVAAGTATTMMPGTALCRREDFLTLVPRVRVRELTT